jgi:hypothetical protein
MKGSERKVCQKFFLESFFLKTFQVLYITRKVGSGVNFRRGEERRGEERSTTYR